MSAILYASYDAILLPTLIAIVCTRIAKCILLGKNFLKPKEKEEKS